jgi:hypothetical protein
MKCLFLVHPETDYGEGFTYNGLATVLGEDNVILYPQKLSYMGFTDFSYILSDGKRGMTNPSGFTVARRLRIYTFEEICDLMPEFDFIVLSSPRHYAVHALRFIKKIYGNKLPKFLVYTDFEDSETLRTDIIEEFNPQVIFKRELTHPIPNVYPLPFSSAVPYLPDTYDDQNKTLDLFCTFGFTHHLRKDVIDFLSTSNLTNSQYLALDIPDLVRSGKYSGLLPYNEYIKRIASAKIAISVRGHGRDTVRYWEIPAFETLFLVNDPGIIIPHPFTDGVNCVQFNTLPDLADKIKYYLSHDEERIKIAKAGKEHLHAWHSNERRAEYFLDIVKEKL